MKKRIHPNCISGQLIRIANVNKGLAVIMCDEANRLGIANKMSLEGIIQKVGAMSAAQYDVRNAARITYAKSSQLNNQRTTDPNGTGVPDKQYAISNYQDVEDCVNGPNGLVSLGVDSQTALENCQSYFQVGTSGGKSSRQTYHVKQVPGSKISLSANKLKTAGNIINNEAKSYYGNISSGGKRIYAASVSPNEVEIPGFVYAITGGNVPNLPNGPSSTGNSNLKGASLDEHQRYIESICEPIDVTLHNRAEHQSDKTTQRIKSSSYEGKPYWAISLGL